MRIAVADLWPKPTHSVVEMGDVEDTPLSSLIYIPVPPHAELGTIHSLLRSVPSPLRRAVDGFVIRPQASDVVTLAKNPQLIQRIQHRMDNKPAWLLEWDGVKYKLEPLPSSGALIQPIPVTDSTIVALRRAETARLLEFPGAILPQLPSLHYEGPNGSHYATFARPGMALRTVAALDGICFWLRQYLTRPTTVLLDSWSMLSLGLKLQLEVGHSVLHVESLVNYHESVDLILGRLTERSGKLPERILLLFSVCSTGSLATKLHNACLNAGCSDLTTVSLFATKPFLESAQPNVFCPLGSEFTPNVRAECGRCKSKSAVVKIEPTTYLMEISAAAGEAKITKDGAKQAREFLNRYSGIDYLSVHRDQHDKTRHHMIHIDISKLLSSSAFIARVRTACDRVRGKVEVVLSPSHGAAKQLAELVREILSLEGNRLLIADDTAISKMNSHQRDTITNSKGILIVDDVVITGDRFWSYRNAMERNGLTAGHRQVHFLVGLERTPDKDTLRGVCDAAHSADHFHPVESLLLPNWGPEDCPWCWEQSQLAKYGEQLEGENWIKARYDALQRVSVGINQNLFLHWGVDGFRPERLGPQSPVFGNLGRDVELFTAVASTVQRLRSENELGELIAPPAAKVLKSELTFAGRYYASVVTAAVFRCTRRFDLRSPTSDPQLLRILRRRLRADRVQELRSETLFAMARDHVPHVDGILNDEDYFATADRGVATFLRLLLQNKIT